MGDNAKVCFSCGESLEKNFTYICNNCGQVNFNNAKKCSRCGEPTILSKFKAVDMSEDSLTMITGKIKDSVERINSNEYKEKLGNVYDTLKTKAKEIPAEKYKDKAENVLETMKTVVNNTQLEEYKQKASQAVNSMQEIAGSVSVGEYKDKIETAYNSAKSNFSKNISSSDEKKQEVKTATTDRVSHDSVTTKVTNTVDNTQNQTKDNSDNHNSISVKGIFGKYKQFICGAVVVVTLFGVYQLGASSTNRSKQVAEPIKQEATKSVEPQNLASDKEQKKEKTIVVGYINGDDVFVRSQPSTDGKPITMLNKRTQVEVLDSQSNNIVLTTYILKVDGCIGYDMNSTQKFTLNKGLALKYESPGKYPNQAYCKIQTAVGEKTVAIHNFSNVAEKITNNDWYKVRLSDGKIGWIYSKFVDISEVEK